MEIVEKIQFKNGKCFPYFLVEKSSLKQIFFLIYSLKWSIFLVEKSGLKSTFFPHFLWKNPVKNTNCFHFLWNSQFTSRCPDVAEAVSGTL